jgi:hypothetical protein
MKAPQWRYSKLEWIGLAGEKELGPSGGGAGTCLFLDGFPWKGFMTLRSFRHTLQELIHAWPLSSLALFRLIESGWCNHTWSE